MSVNTQLLFGPLLCGTFLNTILYGVCAMQAFTYWRTYERDRKWMRYFVLYLFVLETLNVAFNIAMVYEPLVLRFSDPRALIKSPIMLVTDPLMTSLISTSAQLFMAWRIKVITGSIMIPIIIAFVGLVAWGGGITLGVLVARDSRYASFHSFELAIIIWLAASAVADLMITATLYWSLKHRKTGIKDTDDKISRIIRLIVHTGLLTAVLAVADLVVAVVVPRTTLNFIWDLALSQMYANALLSTLNARPRTASAGSTPDDNMLFGVAQVTGWEGRTRVIADLEQTRLEALTTRSVPFSLPHTKKREFSGIQSGVAITTIVEHMDDDSRSVTLNYGEKDSGNLHASDDSISN